MGTKKLINICSSPPISYKRHCDNYQLSSGNRNKNKSNNNTHPISTCCSVGTNTTTMFTKLRNYFTQIRKSSTTLPARHRHEKLTNCYSIPKHNNTTSNSNSSNNRNSSYSTNANSSTRTSMFNVIGIVMLVLLALINTTTSNPVFVDNPSLAQFQSGRNIRHLPCIVRKSGRSGICMFAIDCIKQNGTHLGTCIDRFYFGSCCDIKEEGYPEIADNSIDQNTISHRFTPESSTMPTSALFKITTLSPSHYQGNISNSIISSSSSSSISSSNGSSSNSNSNTVTKQDVTQMLNSVTQSFVPTTMDDTSRPTTLVTGNTNSRKPNKTTTTTKPTTHKHSQFVIRTTARPTKKPVHHYTSTGSKPTQHNTTTKKKTTPTTSTSTSSTTTSTTRKPVLTTTDAKVQQDELQVEVTTLPTKLFTYQIVETTVGTPTEPTKIFDFVTTDRTSVKTTTKEPQTTTTEAPIPTTTPKRKVTATVATTTTTTHKTTIKYKPQTTRKPTTTKKPTTYKRTTAKPTRKPVTTATTIADIKTQTNDTTIETTYEPSTTSFLASNKTTNAPRPKPRPTASIVRVTKPTTTSTYTTTTTSTTHKPTTLTTTTSAPQTSTTSSKVETTTTTSKQPITTTTSVDTTQIATTNTPPGSSPSQDTEQPIIASTTHKPGLVTWTNIDGEPVVEPNKPINSDWIPVTVETPLMTHNKVEDEYSTKKTTVEEVDVSMTSSVSAMMNNQTIIITPPKKPVLVQKPTTAATTTTIEPPTKPPQSPATTSSPPKPTTTTTTTTTTQKPTSTSSLTTSEQPETISTTVSHQFTTEGIPFTSSAATTSSGVTSEEITTESLNLNGTTMSPVANGLEGVDYRQVCGRRMFPEPRIVGGSNAAFGRWPWQISLRQWRTSTYLHKCGAALLNENWAITAAHCVDNVPPSDLLLRLGEYDLAEEEEPYGYQERRVQIVASHPQFDPRTFEYDLALLRFYEPVAFQPNIIPVCVPQDDENFIGQTAFVTGWGRLYEDGPLPSVLQEVAVPVINNTICETMYRSAGYIEHIPHIFICAGWKKGGYDSCEGDSGGPMVLQRESDKRFQLGGVISWGIGCAEANQPGVYTRISEFRDWINQILQF